MNSLNHGQAQALSHVVRAVCNGECPKCHKRGRIIGSDTSGQYACPCGFTVTVGEMTAAKAESDASSQQLVDNFMDRNVDIFEKWRNDQGVINGIRCAKHIDEIGRVYDQLNGMLELPDKPRRLMPTHAEWLIGLGLFFAAVLGYAIRWLVEPS